MNRKIATVVVTVLVFAMVGTIAWNEYVQERWGVWERRGVGARESTTSTTKPMLANSPSPMFTNTQTPIHPGVPSPTRTSTQAPPHPSSPTPMHPGTPTPLLPLTHTPTHTTTPTPAVTIPLMQVVSQFGVNLRDTPGGEVIQGLADGTLVQPYPSSEEEADSLRWLHVVTLDGVEGWLAVNNLIPFAGTPTATP